MKQIKAIGIIIMIFTMMFCNVPKEKEVSKLDAEMELARIEILRANFQQAIKEKRYDDLKKFAHKELISIGPGSAAWKAYRKMREASGGKFRYDSIIMIPLETVVLSDTMAYDRGVSSVFYTDSTGHTIELKDSFLVILKKDREGNWRLYREMASANVK